MRRFCITAIPLKSARPRLWMAVVAGCVWLLAGAGRSQAYEVNGAQAPLGVYADVNIAEVISRDLHLKQPLCSALPQGAHKTKARNDLKTLYDDLLNHDGLPTPVSGIKLGAPWCLIQVCEPDPLTNSCQGLTGGNDWSYLDDLFDEAKQWGKTVQLDVTPGFDTPNWLLTSVTNGLKSCDGLFPFSGVGTADPDCGKVTFSSFAEQSHAQGAELPLPWADAYLSRWETFLRDLRRQYSARNKNEFVSIAVAGPVGASAEMILPTCDSPSCTYGLVVQPPPPPPQLIPTIFPADAMWTQLINNAMNCSPTDCKRLHAFPNYTIYKSNANFHEQIFVDAWIVTIDSYERIFSGVTRALVPDAGHGLPDVGPLPGIEAFNVQGVDPKIYDALEQVDCGRSPSVSCQAKVEVLTHFATAQVPGTTPNAKSTEVGGMTASTSEDTGAIDVPSVKVLTLWPSPPLPKQPEAAKNLFGGAAFDHPVSSQDFRKETGCNPKGSPPPPCDTTEEAAFNVLDVFFNCTEAGDESNKNVYGDAFVTDCKPKSAPLSSTAPAKIQYVDLSYSDIKYAYTHACPRKPYNVPLNASTASCWSLEDLLNQANFDLFKMAGQEWTKPQMICAPTTDDTCAPTPQK